MLAAVVCLSFTRDRPGDDVGLFFGAVSGSRALCHPQPLLDLARGDLPAPTTGHFLYPPICGLLTCFPRLIACQWRSWTNPLRPGN